jgi:hypothetical protein
MMHVFRENAPMASILFPGARSDSPSDRANPAPVDAMWPLWNVLDLTARGTRQRQVLKLSYYG